MSSGNSGRNEIRDDGDEDATSTISERRAHQHVHATAAEQARTSAPRTCRRNPRQTQMPIRTPMSSRAGRRNRSPPKTTTPVMRDAGDDVAEIAAEETVAAFRLDARR